MSPPVQSCANVNHLYELVVQPIYKQRRCGRDICSSCIQPVLLDSICLCCWRVGTKASGVTGLNSKLIKFLPSLHLPFTFNILLEHYAIAVCGRLVKGTACHFHS